MNKMKKFGLALAVLTVSVGIMLTGVHAENDISVYVDGKAVTFDAQPRIIENRTMVPMRAIFEALGATVSWDAETRTASSVLRDTTVSIAVDSEVLVKNGTEIALDVPARVAESRTLVPVRAVAESFDCKVEWLADRRTVRIVTSHLDDYKTPADEDTYVTIGGRAVSRAEFEYFAGENTKEEVLEYFKSLAAIEQFAEQNGYMPDVLQFDSVDAEIQKQIDAGELKQAQSASEPSIAVLRRYYRDYLMTQVASYQFSYACLNDSAALSDYLRQNAVRVKHILTESEDTALELENRLKNGESFETLVTEYSLDGMDPETGYVFAKGDMVEEFETASYALKEGETSAPIKTQFGYHIIRRYSFDGMSDEDIIGATSSSLLENYCQQKFYEQIDAVSASLAVTYAGDRAA